MLVVAETSRSPKVEILVTTDLRLAKNMFMSFLARNLALVHPLIKLLGCHYVDVAVSHRLVAAQEHYGQQNLARHHHPKVFRLFGSSDQTWPSSDRNRCSATKTTKLICSDRESTHELKQDDNSDNRPKPEHGRVQPSSRTIF
jgi:hypothetical protein